ncbi:MAG: tRNA lysidine(34) synthetase TilS [Desulfobacterales bacterium]|nr:tRNA lysidine(34) synthetase TilS [Desulfobacterales bacterium]
MSTLSNPFSPRDFFKNIRHTISVFQMLGKGDSVLAGVSGGPDSVALLHLLSDISKTLHLRLGVAHLNHGLRGEESDADAGFVENLAKKLSLPFYTEKIDLFHMHQHLQGVSLEEAGREARYAFFNQVMENEGFDKIALGHHTDDTAEIILINLIRGSGPAGLTGIPPVRGKVIRPLIRTSRESILSYLMHNQFEYRTDSSNSDERFLRNKIRHQLIPILTSQYNPKFSKALNRLGTLLSDEEQWISQYIDLAMEQCAQSKESHIIILSIDELFKHHIAVQRRLIRRAICYVKGNLRRISHLHVDDVINLCVNAGLGARLDLPDRIRIHIQDGRLLISKEKKSLRSTGHSEKNDHPVCYERAILASEIFEGPIFIKECRIGLKFNKLSRQDVLDVTSISSDMVFFDWDSLVFPLKMRNYRAGDYFTPLGMAGRQQLKKFFINNKISRLKRLQLPVLLSENKIIWVVGERISDHVKVTPETKTILCAQLFLNK